MRCSITLMTLIAILLFSCTKETNTSDELKALAEYGYFPLHLGNQWNFVDGSQTRTDSILNIAGNDYFRFVSNAPFTPDTSYYRRENNIIFEWRTKLNLEIKKYRFDLELGKAWDLGNGRKADIGGSSSFISNKAILQAENYTIENCLEFSTRFGPDKENIVLAPGMGRLRTSNSCCCCSEYTNTLTRIQIDGKVINLD